MGPDDPRRVAAISAAAARLRVDYAGAAAIRALDARGIPSVLLKGASIAHWLYEPEEARTYGDCDLLVPPDGFPAALAALREIGFEPELDETAMPSWWREHAVATIRHADGIAIDVHRSLPGVRVVETQAWATLSAHLETMPLGDGSAQVLDKPARLLHAALHVAQHAGPSRDVDVLERAIGRIDADGLRAAAALATRLEAVAAFRRGLDFLPAGEELARQLGLDSGPLVEIEIRAAGPPEALTLARVFEADDLATRLSLVRYKLVPPRTFMLKWSPLATRGPIGLAAAYVWRPIWIVTRLPRAARTWAQARRAARAGKSTDGS